MTKALYWDTEGTGLRDPWLQEYAGILHDTSTDTELWCARGFVQLPPGVVPEAGALQVHNITAEECNREGIGIATCCSIFWSQVALAEMVVGYNIEFDLNIMRTMSVRYDVPMHSLPRVVELSNWAEQLCMLPPTPKMVAAKRYGYKRPSLSEAMRILCPNYTYTAHRALPDAQACRVLHRAIKEKLDDNKANREEATEAATPSTQATTNTAASEDALREGREKSGNSGPSPEGSAR